MMDFFALVILLPLVGGSLALLLGKRAAPAVGVVTSLLTMAAVGGLSLDIWDLGEQRYAVGGWIVPLGINLYADGLSILMLLMTATVGVLVSIYATGYFREAVSVDGWSEKDAFWPLWLLLWGALNALFLSADLFNLYVTLELMSLAAVALIVVAGGGTALTAGMRYLLAAFLGSLTYLLGVALLYATFGSLDLFTLAETIEPTTVVLTAIGLISVGLILKTALFPLHFWLPQAHTSAPAPVSALLSGLVVKASFYMLVRLWFEAFPDTVNPSAAQLMGVLGASAVLWGSLHAIAQTRLKLLIAYSTVAQIGYLFVMMPLALAPIVDPEVLVASWSVDAWRGGIYQALSHAFAKASMFMAAGSIMYALGHDRIADLRGVAEKIPMTTVAFGISGISLMGLPPTGGFVAKWLLLRSSIASGQWWWVVVIILGGLLAAAYVLVVMRQMILRPEDDFEMRPIPKVMELATITLAVMSILLGLRSIEALAFLDIGGPFPPVVGE
jgi:multicomponent Na+:H+ antiporter subunit D